MIRIMLNYATLNIEECDFGGIFVNLPFGLVKI